EGLREKIKKSGKIKLYLGIDPTGSQLHLGHSIPLRKLQQFQEQGHHVIFLIGSFTAMIGDPTGRDEARVPLTREQVEANFKNYKKQASKVLDFKKVEIRYNHEWLEKLSFTDVLKLSSHFTIQQMLQRDMFRERMKRGEDLSPNEFMYPLMQGYDSVALDVDLEIGGNDQLFNMLAGRKLMKALKNKEKWVLTTPLIEGIDGRKMSKTYGNTVNIEDEPGDMFGKLMSLSDSLIIKYFLLCTDVPIKTIDEIDAALKDGENPKDAKVRLATEIVAMYHNAKAAEKAKAEFEKVFSKGGVPDDMPVFELKGRMNIIDLLEKCKLVESRGDAKRMIAQNAVKVDDKKITAVGEEVKLKTGMVIQVGKRKFARIG
ncbi:MAG: tyrosine--tRNA ligase, partial [Candidatus Peregrinibacteria bacterium]